MKKLISFLLLILVFGCVICYATETPTVSLVQKEIENTNEICIDVTISENSKACGGKIDISYDNILLKPDKYEISDAFSNGMFLVNLNYEDNVIRLSWAGTEEITLGGTMCSITFSIVEDKPFATTVGVSQCKLSDVNSEPISANVEKCEITHTKKESTSSHSRPSGNSSVTNQDKGEKETVGAEQKTIRFNDVKETDWYYASVQHVVENKLMNGVAEDMFAPNDTLTRAMLVTILYRNEGEPIVDKQVLFADVDKNAYYADAFFWAKHNGIVNGITENEFAPNSNITREQIATIIYRYAQYKGYDVSVEENTSILSYSDAKNISEYALLPMHYTIERSFIKGKSDVTLNPKDNATRAEISAILQRFIETNKMVK